MKCVCREESENSKQSKTSSVHDENFVIPYESLAVGSDGNDLVWSILMIVVFTHRQYCFGLYNPIHFA